MSDELARLKGTDGDLPDGSPAITVEHIAKRYRLYRERPQSIKRIISGRERSRYDEFWALDDVSLEVQAGTTYGLIGHNGSGKSTLLRMMAGIQQPTRGNVTVNGRVSALLELGAGFHPELSGRENIYLNGSILGLSKKNIDKSVEEIVEFSGLGAFVDSPVKVYSSGMYVRLGFSVAVHVNPEILIIDEVIAVGDEEFQRRCLDHLFKLRQEGVTIVIVTHAMALIDMMCNRAAWLDHGKLLAEGPAPEVTKLYLAQVNRQEMDRAEARGEAGPPVTPVPNSDPTRRGTREIEITGFEVIDAAGKQTEFAESGDAISLRILYNAHKTITNPTFSLGLHTEGGMQLASPNTRFGGVLSGTLSGPGFIDYRIDHLGLLSGSYSVTAAVSDELGLHPFDVRERAFTLRVRSGRSSERMGILDLGGRWIA